MRNTILVVVALLVILVGFSGFRAAAKNRSNPPIRSEPAWNSARTRELASGACFDCHSNETRWPVYSGLPLIGGLIDQHVREGRSELNFSEWGVPGRENEDGDEAAEMVFEPMHYAEDGAWWEVPYTWTHPKARLSDGDRESLAQGLRSSLGHSGEGEEDGGAENDGEVDGDRD